LHKLKIIQMYLLKMIQEKVLDYLPFTTKELLWQHHQRN
jgi:hypothetical protein